MLIAIRSTAPGAAIEYGDIQSMKRRIESDMRQASRRASTSRRRTFVDRGGCIIRGLP